MRLEARLSYALIGLVQATGYAGGLDYAGGSVVVFLPVFGNNFHEVFDALRVDVIFKNAVHLERCPNKRTVRNVELLLDVVTAAAGGSKNWNLAAQPRAWTPSPRNAFLKN